MSYLDTLIDQRARAWNEVQNIRTKLATEKLTEDEDVAYNRSLDEVDKLSKDIEREERAARMEAVDYRQVTASGAGNPSGEQREATDEYPAAFRSYLRRGMAGSSTEHRQLLQANFDGEMRANATSPGTAGGYLIPTDTLAKITEVMKAFGGILGDANVINTSTGNPLNWPSSDETAAEGVILGENTDAGASVDLTWGQKTLGAFTYSSKLVRISLQLLQDNVFDVDGFVARKLGERLGRIVAKHLATGVGTTTPEGLFTNATAGKTGAAAQLTTFIYDDLVDLIHSIDPAYRGQAKWELSDTALKAIRKLKDTQGRPLWEPSLQAGVPSTLLGYGYTIDNGIPVPAASAKSLGFGDIKSAYVVRQVAGGQLMRLEERYAEFLQVGFLGFLRLDAKPDDLSAFRVFQHAAS